ncbi:MAG: cyclic nucleotide-binding domain-containing protein [Actinomycetota bacterium]
MTEVAHARADTAFPDFTSSQRLKLEIGDVLINQGEVSDSVYILVDGALEVSRRLDEGSAVLAVIEDPGSVVGEIVAMAGGERTATVQAASSCEVIELTADTFHAHLKEHPEIAERLVAIAVERAEEVELTEILAEHFDISDSDTLATTCRRVGWRRLNHGEVLFEEGEDSDAVYIVVSGRLLATTNDPVKNASIKIGEMGRGEVVGEIGLLGHTPRSATVTAVRDSVIARLDEPVFLDLVQSQPRMMIELSLRAVARTRDNRWHSAPNTVLAVVGSRDAPVAEVLKGLEKELGKHGDVHRLSPERVDTALETPGIHDAARGEVADIRVSRMVHELELEADHLVIEVGDSAGPWSQRTLGMADRVLIVVSPDLDSNEVERLNTILGGCPVAVKRTAVITRSSGAVPTDSSRLADDLGADDVFNIAPASEADISRLARVSVGRGNTLVLSGGGARGFAHIGVYRALTELGLPVDVVGGTSMGAIIGGAIANGMDPDQLVEWAHQHFPNALDYTLPIVSLTKGSNIARSARATFGDRDIEDLWLTYFAASTDLTNSRLHIHDSGPIALAIRATSAIPGVMPPVPFGDSLLIDGGVLNNLPIDIARTKSPLGPLVAVDVAPPRGPGAHSDYGLSVSGWDAIRSSFGSGKTRYPRISAVLMRSMITASMLERDTQVSSGQADCYLDLDMRGVSMLEFGDPATVATRGYETAMPELEAWLEETRLRADPVAR